MCLRSQTRGTHAWLVGLLLFLTAGGAQAIAAPACCSARPNIVFVMADDWSWPHASILGDPAVQTPHFDRVAREGVLFENAFVSTPSCTPSRLSILTGQHHWRLREGASLGGSLREEYAVYTELLQEQGYLVGRFGKGVWPSKHRFRNRDSFGERFPSFERFLEMRQDGQPFCYWHGGQDPHRPYTFGSGAKNGIDPADVRVPPCLPDDEIVRGDVADYLFEVQRFDRELGAILSRLTELGELDNTIVVVSGDNGMPFPRCKSTLYDQGTRVPLAIRWGEIVEPGRRVDDMTSLCDLAPTFLEAAGIDVPAAMTGISLMGMLKANDVRAARDYVLSGLEQHVYLNPARALRTRDFLLIRNFAPETWKTGEVPGRNPRYDFATTPWPTGPGAFSFNIDPSPTKQFLRRHRDEPRVKPFADLALRVPPALELYDLRDDPHQLRNVAAAPEYRRIKQRLSRRLTAELIKSDDPRVAVEGYTSHAIEGWAVRVSETLRRDQPEKTRVALQLLAEQLRKVIDVLPADALDSVRTVPIWLSAEYPGVRPTGEYHPGAAWLRRNGREPALHQCIEFTNIAIFEREVRRMPVLVLHELAHAYHDQVLGFEHPRVKAAYERAKNSGRYESVERNNGRKERAYAITNHKEYFAELSEALFGINDFYPFNRSELQEHDPETEKLLLELWTNGQRD